jgi:hypothetical protein
MKERERERERIDGEEAAIVNERKSNVPESN